MLKYNQKYLSEIKKYYSSRKKDITGRMSDFRQLWANRKYNDIFAELIFCHLTPQSSAKTCWKAVEGLKSKNCLFSGSVNQIKCEIGKVRFKNNKSLYITRTQKLFPVGKIIRILKEMHRDPVNLREWLDENIKGMGYKESSHFLRNIGLGESLAILDRHILKNLKLLGVIKEIPETITKNTYLDIENKMIKFSKEVNIPLSHLDLLFWSKQTGEIFK